MTGCTSATGPAATTAAATISEAPAAVATTPPTAPKSAIATPATGVDRTACWFFWRKSDAHSFRPADQETLVFDAPGDKAFKLGDYDLTVTYDASAAGELALSIAAEAGRGAIRERFDFGAAAAAAHLPAGGHGFTGLRYLTHPGSKSELQYFCGGFDASLDLTDDAAAQSTPGPVAPAGSRLECTTQRTDAAGTSIETKTLSLSSGGDETTKLGDFNLAVRHMVGEYDSGGVIVDVGLPGTPTAIHSMYQLHGADLPANLVRGPSFTGAQTLTDTTSGESLNFTCRTL